MYLQIFLVQKWPVFWSGQAFRQKNGAVGK